jgi:hypothetical protein
MKFVLPKRDDLTIWRPTPSSAFSVIKDVVTGRFFRFVR